MTAKRVYLDNGATTKVDPRAAEAMVQPCLESYGNPSSLHSHGRAAAAQLEKARKILAQSINAHPEEIIFTSGGTESDNFAIRGVAQYFGKGHIITTQIEHPAVLNACAVLEEKGFTVTYLPVNAEGAIELAALEEAITEDTILISIMHVNNEVGIIQDLEAIGNIAAQKGVLFHSDTVQSFTKASIDVRSMNLALASFSAHKVHGPKGVGALYIRKDVHLKKLLAGGKQERNCRSGTENVPGIIGFARAVEVREPDECKRMCVLRNQLIDGILALPNTHLNGPREQRCVNNVNISFLGIPGDLLLMHLDMHGISVSTGSACSAKKKKPSHVLTALGIDEARAKSAIRFSLGRFTTEEDITYTIEKLNEVVPQLRELAKNM